MTDRLPCAGHHARHTAVPHGSLRRAVPQAAVAAPPSTLRVGRKRTEGGAGHTTYLVRQVVEVMPLEIAHRWIRLRIEILIHHPHDVRQRIDRRGSSPNRASSARSMRRMPGRCGLRDMASWTIVSSLATQFGCPL